MPRGFFITGTDTNVGKTVLASLLCAGMPGSYWKPIQTGASQGTDREQVVTWTGIKDDRHFPEAYVFDDPVSPHLAARRAGREILLETIKIPSADPDVPLIVEGAGGVMVPINGRQFMTDLIRHLSLPAILAARSTLGTINHTLLSLQCMRDAGIAIRGVVLIGPENPENRKAIEYYGKTQVLADVPVLPAINREALREIFKKNFAPRSLA